MSHVVLFTDHHSPICGQKWRIPKLFKHCNEVSSEKNSKSMSIMGLRAVPLPPSIPAVVPRPRRSKLLVSASSGGNENDKDKDVPRKAKQSLFGAVTEALDFSLARSEEDAQLLEEARDTTRSGSRMSREQYGALRRKIGGTYKDFFKSYVEVEGQYVEEGWVDKTCKVCKKDTRGEARQVDKMGRYAHVSCLEKSLSGNFFTRLFSR